MSAPYTAWFDYVFPRVAGASTALVLQAIRESVIEFCRASTIYRDDLSAVNIVGGTSTYTVVPPTDTVVSAFLHVEVDGEEIDPHDDAWLDSFISDWRTTATGPARAYRHPDTNQIQLVPTPSESITGGLVVTCALKPTEASTSCADFLLTEWRQAITDGALERLFVMPRVPWSNAGLYKEHQSEFTSWCNAAAARADKGGTRIPLRSSISW